MKKMISFWAFLFALVTIVAVIAILVKAKPLDIKCDATLDYELSNQNDVFSYSVTHNITLSRDGSGYDHIRGAVYNDGKSYALARTVYFSYKSDAAGDAHNFSVDEQRLSGIDNVPDSLISQYLTYLLPKEKRLFTLNMLNGNKILISTYQGPYFICNIS